MDISTLSTNVANQRPFAIRALQKLQVTHPSHAAPRPYHAARLMRACDHENTHGMVRRSSSDWAPKPRLAGRLPMGSRPTSAKGVTVENHGAKPSVCSRSR